jgi:hypothetical protein
LDLPEEWRKPKIYKVITEILPQTLQELKDKEFCTDCTAGFTVMLVIDSQNIVSRNNFSNGYSNQNRTLNYTREVIYSFRASLGLFDSSLNMISEVLLVQTDEQHALRSSWQQTGSSQPVQQIRSRRGRVTEVSIPAMINMPINNDTWPTLIDMVNISEQKLYHVRDVLRKLKAVSANK